jgi:uncharacterized protein (DUF2236 family)
LRKSYRKGVLVASNGVLPSEDEVPSLLPGPESVAWRRSSDARILATAGYALILQVAHPTVGAGVHEHSNFEADPWGRLLRTLDYTTVMTYGSPELAGPMGRRIHEMHKHIKGTKPDGERYFALEPEAYAWVHATLAQSIVAGTERFARRMSPVEVDRFYAEWLGVGRLIGVPAGELPERWLDFRAYFDRMIDERLEDNETVHTVLRTLAKPTAPPLPMLNDPVWRVARLPMARLGALATVGLLPPRLRSRLGLQWTRGQELELRALAALSRSVTPLMPASLRCFGPAYLRWRRDAIERGDVASRTIDRQPRASWVTTKPA